MKLSRIRSGEALALAGAIALAVLLGTDWFKLSTAEAYVGAHESGIRSLGWFAALILVVTIGLTFAFVWTTLTGRSAGVPIGLTVLASLFSMLAVIVILVRLVLQPGLGLDVGNADVDIAASAWLGLVATLAIAVGAWRAMGDERTDTDEARRQTERVVAVRGEPKPAPPAQAPGA